MHKMARARLRQCFGWRFSSTGARAARHQVRDDNKSGGHDKVDPASATPEARFIRLLATIAAATSPAGSPSPALARGRHILEPT
jgi:hypothetical protein